MKTLHTVLISGWLALACAGAQAGPHWSSAIGTGHVANDQRSPGVAQDQNAPAPLAHSSPLHWSAFIGSGHILANPDQRGPARATLSAHSSPLHWSALIGSGHISAKR